MILLVSAFGPPVLLQYFLADYGIFWVIALLWVLLIGVFGTVMEVREKFNEQRLPKQQVTQRRSAYYPPRPASHKKPTPYRREPISKSVKMYVWQRDGGRCVECGSREKLEYDHIIPLSRGGSNTDRNLQLLCEPCNRSKANKWV